MRLLLDANLSPRGVAAKLREAGHEVLLMPHLRAEIAPADDRRALADLQACLKGFDVVHTHSSKAGDVRGCQ